MTGTRMKIASFNINNIRKRLPNLLEWLRQAQPDVVCLQELKTTDAEFPAEAIRRSGYEAVPKELERRRHSWPRGGADRHAHRAPGRSGRRAESLHRGRGERRAGRLFLRAERQPAA